MKLFDDIKIKFEKALIYCNRIESEHLIKNLKNKMDVHTITNKIIFPVLQKIGSDWDKGFLSLSQVYMSGKICNEILDKLFPLGRYSETEKSDIAIVALEDYHILGKKIVLSMLQAKGYNIIDYGHGLTCNEVIVNLKKDNIKILLISTLMLHAALKIKVLIQKIKEMGLTTKVIVGGAPFLFDKKLWKEVKADAMGQNAVSAVNLVSDFQRGIK